jgi:hypothetical protein
MKENSFLEMMNTFVVEFHYEEWKCDFTFFVVIMQHMNDLNLKIRERGKYIGDLSSFVNSSQTKLRIWLSQMRNRNVIHFQNHMFSEKQCAKCANIMTFGGRVSDIF